MGFFKRRSGQGVGHAPVEISERHGVRSLHLGGPAVQSAMRIRDPWYLELEYTRAMMACLLLRPEPRDMALIGLGGGSLAKFVHRHLPDARLTALEVNPEVVGAARAFFALPPDDERLTVRLQDGAAYVREHPQSQDVLLVDGYDARRIVEDLASVAFYTDCLAMLRAGGLAAFNLWGSDRSFPAYLARLGQAFGDALLRLPAERKGNVIVFAFRPPLPDMSLTVLSQRARTLESALGLEMEDFLMRLRNWNPTSRSGFLL
ncbi:MAG TPA: spermidine synthase [Thiobacillaceae bacterium]|nr:spermidine synthase [Thiobacillaceae bacterium]HNU64368.1 spermidine synthase [Thiobacillaceae bacterium]